MILQRDTYNNGYGCSCCRHDWEDTEWIDEKEMDSLEEIINYVYNREWYDSNCNHLGKLYEKNGKVIYGFQVDFYRVQEDVWIIIGDRKYQVYLDYDESSHTHGKQKKEIIEIGAKNDYK